jgi:hypothetical protein
MSGYAANSAYIFNLNYSHRTTEHKIFNAQEIIEFGETLNFRQIVKYQEK